MKDYYSDFDHELTWTEISRKPVFEKFSRGVDDITFKLPNGQTRQYYIKQEVDTVCTLAFSKSNQVILARQFRPGPQKILFTLPGGGIKSNNDPKANAARELKEETGYAGDFTLAATFYDDGYSTSRRYCFLSVNCEKVSSPKLDSTEFITTVELPIDIFINKLRGGSVTDPEAAFAAIDYIMKISSSNKKFCRLGELFKQSLYS
jgi:ADP-ribose pyrophosphatase